MAMNMNINMDILVLVSITSLLLLSAPTILAHKQPPSTISQREPRLLCQLQEICDKTGHPSLCTDSFLPYYNKTSSFKNATRVDPLTVLYAVVDCTSECVQRAVAVVRRPRNDTSFGGALHSQLGVREEVYGNVVVDLRTAVDEEVSQMGVVCWDLVDMLNWSLHD